MTVSVASVERLLPEHWMRKDELLRWAEEVGAELPPRATKATIYSEIVFTVGNAPTVVTDDDGHPRMVMYAQPPLPAWAHSTVDAC